MRQRMYLLKSLLNFSLVRDQAARELALMHDLSTLLRKLAQGRDISVLGAYE